MKIAKKKHSLLQGAYLTERAASDISNDSSDDTRYQRWIQSGGFSDKTLRLRLSHDGLTEQEFRRIVQNRNRPKVRGDLSWIHTLSEIFQDRKTHSKFNIINKLDDKYHAFLPFYTPFLSYAHEKLLQIFQRIDDTYVESSWIDASSVMDSILETLHNRLLSLSLKTLISEMHIAKLTGQLVGETPEERYLDFVERFLSDPSQMIRIFEIYPVLARLMTEATERAAETHKEALERFIKDRKMIQSTFDGDFSRLIQVRAGAGDTHQSGRSVTIFVFESGSKLVYKPRPMAIDEHFVQLIEWINRKGFSHQLIAARVLNCGNYGWQSYIQAKGCNHRDEVRRFYHRQGAYTALLYVLRSSDIHAENIIACGEHPVLIDLETLFTNHLETFKSSTTVHKTVEEMHDSVFASLMLPIKLSTTFFDLDISGIGGGKSQKSEKMKTWKLDRVGTDEMRIVETPVVIPENANRPILNGEEVTAVDYIDEIEEGFREMYQLLLIHRQELMSKQGPIHRFSNDPVRHVLRPTNSYLRFLDASTHPDYLRNGLDRVQLFDLLWRITDNIGKFTEVVHLECRDLLTHDIPYFTFRLGGRSLYDSRGGEIPDFYEKSCLERVMERCRKLSPEDLKKQVRYIRMSLATLIEDPWSGRPSLPFVQTEHRSISRNVFLREARKIGDELLDQSIWSDDGQEAYWIDLNLQEKEQLDISPLDEGIYNGALGIVLFLAHLARETEDEKYERLSRAALKGTLSMMKKDTLSISAFHGLAGVVYTLAHLGLLWNDSKMMQQAFQYMESIEGRLPSDQSYDLVGGAAGALLVCLRLHSLVPDSRALQVAIQCGEYICRHVRFDEKGDQLPLTGLSHGAAGFVWAWTELADATGQDRFYQAARKALDFERTHFIPDENNWADLRHTTLNRETPVYWCHGAPGIGLSRLMIDGLLEDRHIRSEREIAMKKTLAEGFGRGHSLCHGDFGNLEFLLLCAKRNGKKDLEQHCLNLGYHSMKQGLKHGWRFGLHEKAELLGFMLGLSGIGYGLLRLWNPSLPCVLTLELPRNSTQEVK